jgi:hypothetical protein
MGIITCIIIASVATPILGGCFAMFEMYLRWCKSKDNEDDYMFVKIPGTKMVERTKEQLPKHRMSFLNSTLQEAAACNCPILCELLIEKGATYIDSALDIAIVNGYIDTCKALINKGTCDLDKALMTATTHQQHEIADYISICKRQKDEKKGV